VLRTYTDAVFDELSWHDCHLVGFAIRAGDADEGDWTSDLVLDLDFIVEWMCGVEGPGQFRIAPATLIFHGVTDLRLHIDWGHSGFQAALHEIAIDRIEREVIHDQKVYLDRPYYRWTIRLNWPKTGDISFGAVGFTQTLLAEPVRTKNQSLSRRERTRLIAGRDQLPR
jgi:hypothetical protein